MTDSDRSGNNLATLSPDDGRILDTILTERGGGDGTARGVETEVSGREANMAGVLAILDAYPVEDPPGDLEARTLERVRMARQRERFTHQIADLSGPVFSFRIGDMLAVAAAVLICASLALPMLSQTESHANKVACASHQSLAGRAVSQYATDHGQMMPRGAVQRNGVWYNVGRDAVGPDGKFQSNSAHLRLIVRSGYVHANTLNCPGNANATPDEHRDAVDWQDPSKISFSYANQYGEPVRFDHHAKMTILTDKNPLFRIYTAGPQTKLEFLGAAGNVEDVSLQHREAGGQNVLYGDGSVDWTSRPVNRDGDNLWLIRGDMDYDGTEAPSEVGDAHHIP